MSFKLKSRGKGDLKRRYRPQRLSEVAPTCSITELSAIIESDNNSQVFLFEGATGTGKTTCARIVARALVCDSFGAGKSKPCLKCASCRGTKKDSFDFQEKNVGADRGIDEIRAMIDTMRHRPMSLRYKVYILDEVHGITKPAQEALKVTLEDPDETLLVFMCTTSLKNLDRALLDRAHRITFRSLGREPAMSVLSQIEVLEGLSIDADVKKAMYESCGGSVRALLNQVQSFAKGGEDYGHAADEEEREPGAKDLLDALLSRNWGTAKKLLLATSVRDRPESMRIAVECIARGYCLSLKGGNKINPNAARVLECMCGSLFNEPPISQYNQFVLMCMRACK